MVWYGMVWYGMVWYPRSFLYGPRCARSVLSRPRADILPVRPSRLVNKIYVWYGMVWYGMVWYGMVWYGMVYACYMYDTVWYGKYMHSKYVLLTKREGRTGRIFARGLDSTKKTEGRYSPSTVPSKLG